MWLTHLVLVHAVERQSHAALVANPLCRARDVVGDLAPSLDEQRNQAVHAVAQDAGMAQMLAEDGADGLDHVALQGLAEVVVPVAGARRDDLGDALVVARGSRRAR